jgi:hypothetical protein
MFLNETGGNTTIFKQNKKTPQVKTIKKKKLRLWSLKLSQMSQLVLNNLRDQFSANKNS